MQRPSRVAFTIRKIFPLLLLTVVVVLLVIVFLPSLRGPQPSQQLSQPAASTPTPASSPASAPTSTSASTSRAFVARSGSTLLLNGQPFRFAGANIHWLGLLEGADEPTYPDQTRIEHVFAAAVNMKATAVRSITLGVSVGCPNCLEPALNRFNDQAFTPIDYAIKTAAEDHLHLIIPLTDGNTFYPGGMQTFTDWRGLSDKQQFFTNPTVIQDFKAYIAHLLNHVNQYTGIALKDDPTIMLWETGNEISTALDSWTEMIAEYIKSLAPHQLVGDGKHANASRDLTSSQLQLPAVDVYTSHFYFGSYAQYAMRAHTSASLAKQYHKAYFIGEYDWTAASGSPAALASFLATTENTQDNIAGDTFYELYDTGYQGGDYTLHYPVYNPALQSRVQLLIQHATKM